MKKTILYTIAALSLLALAMQCQAAVPSKIWPMSDEGAAYMIENLPNVESVGYMVGPDVKEISPKLYAVLEAPAYIELISTTLNYSGHVVQPQVADVIRDGKPYKRYTFDPPSKDTERWARCFTQWVPRPSAADRNSPGVIAWHFETPEGPEAEQTLELNLLPELPKQLPPLRTLVHFYNSPNCNIDPARLDQALTLLSRSGVNLLGEWEASAANLKTSGCYQLGIKLHDNMGGMHNWHTMESLPTDPRYQNRDHLGNPINGQDAQWLIDGNGQPWADDLAACKAMSSQVDAMTQDIEWGPLYDNGFSQAGVEAFAKSMNLDPAGLTPQLIWDKYRTQWGDFRANQYLILARYYSDAARAGNPKSFTLWNPGSPYTTTDPALMSNMIELGKDSLGRMTYLTFPFPTTRMQEGFEVLEPMWYGHGVGQVQEAFAWAKAISSVVKVPLVPLYEGQGREYYYPGGDPGEVLRAMSWAAMLGGAKGWGYWLNDFSPLQYWWMSRTAREVGRVEDVLFDGKPDSPDVKLTPMPKNHFILTSGSQKKIFPIPDFSKVGIFRSFSQGNKRVIGVLNLDLGIDAYYKLAITGLPTGSYRVLNVTENKLVSPTGVVTTFTAEQLKAGMMMVTPAKYGVTVLLVAPSSDIATGPALQKLADLNKAYTAYKQPDTQGSNLAERGGLSVRYDIVGREGETAILMQSPTQQVWVRPQSGGIISDWKIKDGNRSVVEYLAPYRAAATDLFWSPADAHWSGDEKGAYELVSAKVHGGKAYVQLRQIKRTPSLGGLVLTKTIILPEQGTDVGVQVDIQNPGPTPQVGFSYWAHNQFSLGAEGASAQPPQYPTIYMQTPDGVTAAPFSSVVWAKPDAPYILGNESFEKGGRNGVTSANWIAQVAPITGEAVLCQVEAPAVAQFYSWRDDNNKSDLSVEWMYPYINLDAGQSFSTTYTMRYLKSVKPQELPGRLLPPAQ